jgi:hypothetical protein
MILFRVLLCISVVKQPLFKRARKAGRSPEGRALGSLCNLCVLCVYLFPLQILKIKSEFKIPESYYKNPETRICHYV